MLRDIHRMELRYSALLREQERLSAEMEKAIQKRAVISNRYAEKGGSKAKKGEAVQPKEMTQAAAKKRIGTLKKDARVLAEETSRYSSAIEEKKAQLREMTTDLERATNEYAENERVSHEVQGQINDLLYRKQLYQERISYKQKFSKRLKELSSVGVDQSQAMQVERKLVSSTQSLDNVRAIISDLQNMHPHLTEVLTRVATMTEPAF